MTKNFDGCGSPADPEEITVRLPGDVRALAEKLRFDVVQEPHLSNGRYPSQQSIEIGQPAELILTGGRLWRSTEVTLGAQKADEIVILPNMEGIIAKFRCVAPQMPLRQGNKPVEVRVWTSEGVTDPIMVELIIPDALLDAMKKMEEAIEKRGGRQRPVVCPESAPDLNATRVIAKPSDRVE